MDEQRRDLPAEAEFGSGLTDALHSGFGIASSFTREIFLTRQAIVGMRFQGGSDQLLEKMEPGSRVAFMREPENRYDDKAIMALDDQGRKLGYIPRHDNGILSALMDAGKYLYGIYHSKPSNVDYYGGGTPPVMFVDLYMREFSMPGDPEAIPRQGWRGSYVVMELAGIDPQNGDPRISTVCAIRVINGEERGMYAVDFLDRKDVKESDYEELAQGLQQFTGYLPVVIHDAFGYKTAALENAWGVYCGKPFSNLVINIFHMAENHLNHLPDYSLESIAGSLGIEADCGSEEENRCRVIWRIYCRLDQSELEKRKETISRSDGRAAPSASKGRAALSTNKGKAASSANKSRAASSVRQQ